MSELNHYGLDYQRTQHNHREAAFAAEWALENRANPGVNFGGGILCDLMVDQSKVDIFHRATGERRAHIGQHEATVVATAIQWLATNCGMSFLERALKNCGYKVVPDPEWKSSCSCCRGPDKTIIRNGVTMCGWCSIPLSRSRIAAIHRRKAGIRADEATA